MKIGIRGRRLLNREQKEVVGGGYAHTYGVGTRLSYYLSWFGYYETHSCDCKNMEKILNNAGWSWCSDNINMIADELESRAQEHGYFFNRLGARVLLNLAIYNTKRASEKAMKRQKGV